MEKEIISMVWRDSGDTWKENLRRKEVFVKKGYISS